MSNSNQERRKTTFGPTMMRIAGVLLAITAVTVWATSFMFARYTTGGKAANDGRVAKFSVDANIEGDDLLVDVTNEEDIGTYKVTLRNNSETVVRCDLELDFTKLNTKLPDSTSPKAIVNSVKVSINGGTAVSHTVPNTNKLLLAKVQDLAPGANVVITLDIGALSTEAVNAITTNMIGLSDTTGETSDHAEIELPFYVKAIFTQVD